MSERNLVVDDAYFEELRVFFSKRDEVEDMIGSYLDELNATRSNAIKSGEVADSLDRYISYVGGLKGKLRAINEDLEKLTQGYIHAIDQADDYLF